MEIIFKSLFGLGDVLATVYSLENLGRQKGIKSFLICQTRSNILDFIFDFFNLKYVEKLKKKSKNTIISNSIRRKKSFYEYKTKGYIHYIARLMYHIQEEYGYSPYDSYCLDHNYSYNPIYFFTNFDSIFSYKNNQNKIFGKKKFLYWSKKLNIDNNFVHLSGCGPFFNYDLKHIKGDLKFLFENMLLCKKFIGVDCGVAHLACVLGIPSDVIITINKSYAKGTLNHNDELKIPKDLQYISKDINISLYEFYKYSYREVNIYKDKNIYLY
jgi:hypothetical protein